MSVRSAILDPTTPLRGSSKRAEIRAKIAANRAKRHRIAEAMKNEAGVTTHTINKENLGGLAYIGTGGIYSPKGRKIVQLYTLAHDCGHIFLHNSDPGYTLLPASLSKSTLRGAFITTCASSTMVFSSPGP